MNGLRLGFPVLPACGRCFWGGIVVTCGEPLGRKDLVTWQDSKMKWVSLERKEGGLNSKQLPTVWAGSPLFLPNVLGLPLFEHDGRS